MLRKQLVVGTLALVTGMLGYSTILPAAPLAEVADSSGASCISPGSEVDKLTVNDSGVTLQVNGTCSGDSTTPKDVNNFTINAVDEGTKSVNIDLARSATVQFPLTVTVGTSALTGKRPAVIGTTAYYDAPVEGTVPEAGQDDYFSYTFADANSTVTKKVTIPISAVDIVVPVDPVGCVDSATVDCKGRLTEWPAGSLVGVRIGAGVTHVYYFDYVKAANDRGSFMAFDGQLKVVSVSLNANDFSLAFPCQITQVGLQHALRYAPSDNEEFGECPLEDGKRYYLNIKSTVSTSDSYSLTVR